MIFIDAPRRRGYLYALFWRNPAEGSMTYRITNECICCGACQPACPVEVITEKDDTFVIDADLCTGCGSCVPACPVGAIREIE
jgi:MinD superfamily P-loop ATPase